jgi:translation initiation factor eIF-2B subunit alpha
VSEDGLLKIARVCESRELDTMALASPPSTPKSGGYDSVDPPSTSFDVAAHYTGLITKDPSLTPAIAAIESLVALLSANPLTTISETLALVSHQSKILLSSQRNPIPLSAGTDLFQRYLISSFQQRSLSPHQSDFAVLRSNLVRNSRLFVSRAKQAPKKIALHSLPFIRDDCTVFTYGASSVVDTLLNTAIEANRYFILISITSPTSPASTITSSTKPSIPISAIPMHALTYALSSLTPSQRHSTSLIIPASAVLENGAVVSALGTQQLALLASSFSIPFYVAVESYKFVRSFPLGSGSGDLARMGVIQSSLLPSDIDDVTETRSSQKDRAGSGNEKDNKTITENEEMIEITPPHLITALITENGIMTPADVAEELIKLWF